MNIPATPAEPGKARTRGLTAIAAVVLLCGAAWGGWHWLHGRHHQSTDNAYVSGNVVQITPQLGGTVVALGADDNDAVKAGQLLVALDPADARVALAQAEAALAQTVREVRALYANNTTLKSQIMLREADVARAQSELARADDDLKRRAPLVGDGLVGQEEFNHAKSQQAAARSALAAAQSAAQAARDQLAAGLTQTEGLGVEQHPNVLRAAAKLREAHLALQRAALVAPIDGHVARRSVQLGQRVQAGTPLLSVVALDQLWVDANFKEGQLADLRIGQPVELRSDVYGEQVVFHGRIAGLGAGTGAAFALLPAQNATGNWIKVVQRVPVRVALEPKELVEHPLRVGLSMEVSVDTQDQSGRMLSDVPRAEPLARTAVFEAQQKAADADVERIVAAALGRGKLH